MARERHQAQFYIFWFYAGLETSAILSLKLMSSSYSMLVGEKLWSQWTSNGNENFLEWTGYAPVTYSLSLHPCDNSIWPSRAPSHDGSVMIKWRPKSAYINRQLQLVVDLDSGDWTILTYTCCTHKSTSLYCCIVRLFLRQQNIGYVLNTSYNIYSDFVLIESHDSMCREVAKC